MLSLQTMLIILALDPLAGAGVADSAQVIRNDGGRPVRPLPRGKVDSMLNRQIVAVVGVFSFWPAALLNTCETQGRTADGEHASNLRTSDILNRRIES